MQAKPSQLLAEPGQPDVVVGALRMTIGTEEANRLVAEGLRDFMAPT
jgi:hypothetical protein